MKSKNRRAGVGPGVAPAELAHREKHFDRTTFCETAQCFWLMRRGSLLRVSKELEYFTERRDGVASVMPHCATPTPDPSARWGGEKSTLGLHPAPILGAHTPAPTRCAHGDKPVHDDVDRFLIV